MKKVSFLASVLFLLTSYTTENTTTSPNLREGRPLSAMLTGAEEVPGPGDPNGSGYAELTLNQGQGTITYTLTVQGIEPAAAAHIHIGAKGVAGKVVVALEPPTDGSTTAVVDVDPELIKKIRQNPEAYYVNVHNATYPGGAVRGQLSK